MMTLHDIFEKNKFGFFLIPGDDSQGAFSYGNKIQHSSKSTENSFYSNTFFLDDEAPWKTLEHFSRPNVKDFKKLCAEIPIKKSQEIINLFLLPPSEDAIKKEKYKYELIFDYYKKYLEKGTIKKAVPFAKFCYESKITSENCNSFGQIFLNLATLKLNDLKKNFYLFGSWNHERQEFFIGNTPELLFHTQFKTLKTCAIAGTILKENPSDFQCPKILEEHNIVALEIEKTFSEFFSLKKKSKVVVEAPQFFHLKTDFDYDTDPLVNFNRIIPAVHPSPALGSFPKRKDIDMSAEFIGNTHDKYAAPLGFCAKEESLFVGLIRGMEWKNGVLSVCCGGGITLKSEKEKEWEEIRKKWESVDVLRK